MQSDNKRLAKNTVMLYIRMLCMMVVSLYTSRVVLAALGVEDYGIYNVVGGIVVVLSFLNSSMAGATQRFLNIEIGKRDENALLKVFQTSLVIHVFIAIIVLFLGETIGTWFLNNYLNIAPERMEAANWVFQCSLISFIVTIISVPYNACIIAHEKMSAFAYISVFEAFAKLGIVYILLATQNDKLKVYALLMSAVAAIVCLIYVVYDFINFKECKTFRLKSDKVLMLKMLGFSGWTIFGALGSISHTQGIGIVINMFFGAAVNAAQGVANQVTGIVNQFVANFMTALNPQIVKTYAANEMKQMHTLIRRGGRLGVAMVAFFAVPLIVETPMILNLWLEEAPEYTVTFIRIILLASICNAYAQPLATAKSATGNIKVYQIILTSLGWLHVPLAWICFELGANPCYAMYVYLVLINIMQACRIYMVCKSINMPMGEYCKEVLGRCSIGVIIAFVMPVLSNLLLPDSIICHLCTLAIGFISITGSIYFIIATQQERTMINSFIISKINRS